MPEKTKTILWYGRSKPNYSRNNVVRAALARLGWSNPEFKPFFSKSANLEAFFRRLPKADAVWVPCFRQRDMKTAARYARRRRIPLIFDPLISAYDKQVFEDRRAEPGSRKAEALRKKEAALFALADVVIADTVCHKAFFHETFGVPEDRICVVYVGAEAGFIPAAQAPDNPTPEVLFYGSFIGLQGPETIVEAARRYAGPPARWVLLGSGPLRTACETAANNTPALTFEPFIDYRLLPGRIQKADILLGVFGESAKASRVIPNKVFQALACGKPTITNASEAYPPEAREAGRGLTFVPPGDPRALADAVEALVRLDPETRAEQGRAARTLFDACFGAATIEAQLQSVLKKAGLLHDDSPIDATVYIVACNEERHIGRALESVRRFREVVVVDSGSTDATCEIVRRYPNARLFQRPWPGYAAQKQWALEQCSGTWVFNIDADEEVTPQLCDAIAKAIAADEVDALFSALPEFFIGHLRRASKVVKKVRFFRRELGRYDLSNRAHEQVVLPHGSRIGLTRAPLLHHGIASVTTAVAKYNAYTSLKAEEKYAKGKRPTLLKLILIMPFTFFRNYILKRDYRDGIAGFISANLAACGAFLREAKLFELSRRDKNNR